MPNNFSSMRITVIVAFIFLPFLGSNGEQILRRKREADAIDFRNAYDDPETGLKCVNKQATIQSIEQERLLECVHSKINVCHYTYVTRFTSQRVEKCDDHYEKICSIVFKNLPTNETLKHCYRPMVKECRDKAESENDDNIICKTVFETECSTRYVEKRQNGESAQKKYVGLTACKKLPVELCGSQYCDFVPGEESCHNKTITSVIPVPEESCDLVPQETCKGVYKLVPYLVPESQCKDVPREVCSYGVKSTQIGEKPLVTKWCYDPTEGTDPSEIVRTGGAREGSNAAVLKNFLSEEERKGLNNRGRPPLNGRLPPPINAIIQNQGQKRPGNRFQLQGENGRGRVSVNDLRQINANQGGDGNNAGATADKKPLDPFSNVFTILSGSEDAAEGPRSVPTRTQIPARGRNNGRNRGSNNPNGVVTFGNKQINSQNGPFRTVIDTSNREITTGPAPIPSEVEYFDQYEDFNVSPPIPTQETRPLTGKDDDTTPATTPKPLFVSQGGVVGTASADVQNELDLKFQVDEASLRQFDEFLKEYEANYEAGNNDDDDFPEYPGYERGINSNAAKDVFPRSTTPRRAAVSTTPNYDSEFEFISKDNEALTTPRPSLSPVSRQRTPKKSNANIRDDFEPFLDDRLQISLAESVQDLSTVSKSSLARVIKHNNSESSIGQTIIIRNTPEAIKLFGIKNIPKEVLLRSTDVNKFKIVHLDNDTSTRDKVEFVTRTTTLHSTSTSSTTTTTTTTTPTPSPSTFSDVFFTHAATTTTTTQRPKVSSESPKNINNFGSFSTLLGIEEFPVNDRVDRNVKDMPLIHFTTGRPSVLNPSSSISFTTSRTPRGQGIFRGQSSSSRRSTTPNPFVTREASFSISRGTPSWERSTTEAKITLKPTQLIVNQTTLPDSRSPKTITFIRNPSITAIQGFAAPDNSLLKQGTNSEKATRQILNLGFQNTVKKHQSIIKPVKVSSAASVGVRGSRNPQQAPFKAPPTLIYGFKPMTTPVGFLSTTRSPRPTAPQRQFSPPSNIHFGFRPMNDGSHHSPLTLGESANSFNNNQNSFSGGSNNFKNFNENLAANNQVKRNVGRPSKRPESSSSPSVLDSIKHFFTSPFKKIIDNF